MNFTYGEYIKLIDLLKEKNYHFYSYLDCDRYNKSVIFRHDIDTSLDKALDIARLEHKNNVSSTFFVLLSTDFYNIFSKKSNDVLKNIISLGHQIGLHFDEKSYPINNVKDLEHYIRQEINVLECIIERQVQVVSMHRPSKWILENDVQFDGIINSYSKKYFSDFKYLSDSRMHWREDVIGIIKSELYNKLHILTHPFWYSEKEETIGEKLTKFIDRAKVERYYNLKDNIRDLNDVINEGDIV